MIPSPYSPRKHFNFQDLIFPYTFDRAYLKYIGKTDDTRNVVKMRLRINCAVGFPPGSGPGICIGWNTRSTGDGICSGDRKIGEWIIEESLSSPLMDGCT